MGWMDLILLAYLALGALYGVRRGLVWVGFSLLGYIAGVIVAEHISKSLTRIVTASIPLQHWVERYVPAPAAQIPGAKLQAWNMAHAILGLLVFLLIVGAVEFVGRTVGAVASRGVRVFRVTAVLNRVGGIAAGILEHGVVAGLILTVLLAVPAIGQSGLSRSIHHAPLASALINVFHRVVKIPGGQYL